MMMIDDWIWLSDDGGDYIAVSSKLVLVVMNDIIPGSRLATTVQYF